MDGGQLLKNKIGAVLFSPAQKVQYCPIPIAPTQDKFHFHQGL